MKAPSLTIDRKNKTITVVMALEVAHPSKATGKTMVIGSTKGLRTSTEQFARRPVCFTANVVYFPANRFNSGGDSADSNGRSTTHREQQVVGGKVINRAINSRRRRSHEQ